MRSLLFLVLASSLYALTGCVSAEARLQQGDAYYAQGNYDLAVESYRDARQADPNLPEIDHKVRLAEFRRCIHRGDEAIDRKDWSGAKRAYEDARRLEPGNDEVAGCLQRLEEARADDHFERGQRLFAEGNPFDALVEFEQALVIQPSHPRAGDAANRARQEKAEREARSESLLLEGQSAWSAGRHEKALTLYEHSLKQNPQNVAAERELAWAKTEYARILVQEANTYMEGRKWEDAIVTYRKAMQFGASPTDLEKAIQRAEREKKAEVLVAEGREALSRSNWQAAYERFQEASLLTATPEVFRSDYEKARDELARQILARAKAAESAGDYEEAVGALADVLAILPDHEDVAGRHARLRTSLQKAAEEYRTGSLAQEAGDMVAAEVHLAECQRELPLYLDARSRLAAVREALARALVLYERAVAAETSEDLERAKIFFDECLSISKPYRDAAERLTGIQEAQLAMAKASVLYRDALRAQDERNLELAAQLLRSCAETRPGYEDVVVQLQEIEAALQTAHGICDRALKAELECELDRAAVLYEECLTIARPCKDASGRLQRIRRSEGDVKNARDRVAQKRIAEALKIYESILKEYRCHREAATQVRELRLLYQGLAKRYEQVLLAQTARDYRRALDTALEIQERCVSYRDVGARIKALESELDYAEGLALQQRKQHAEAASYFQRCANRTPGFRDVDERLDACQELESSDTDDGGGPNP